jgi:hypothetical protein
VLEEILEVEHEEIQNRKIQKCFAFAVRLLLVVMPNSISLSAIFLDENRNVY